VIRSPNRSFLPANTKIVIGRFTQPLSAFPSQPPQ
jgi:hypothetical protein